MFFIALGVYWLFRCPATQHDEHLRLAFALYNGHWFVDGFAPWEHVDVLSHSYELHPILSAIVCFPFVALGYRDQTAISVLIGAVGVALCFRMTRSYWLAAFLALGTVYGYEATLGASWGFCLVLSTLPTFLALTECFGECRPWRVGLWAALAFFARTDLGLVWPVYLWMVIQRRGWIEAIEALVPMQLAVIVYLALNIVRFNSLLDPTLSIWYWQDIAGGKGPTPWGPFSLRYLPLGVYTALFRGPQFQMTWPWLRPSAFGQSLLLTSPALLLAFRDRYSARESRHLLLASGLSVLPALCVWSNGVEQFGARYWIQAFPFLIALMALAPLDRTAKALIILSIILCVWQTYSIRTLGWA